MGASERTYDYLIRRVEYPGDSKWLTVHSRIHVNKEVRMEPSFSRQFSDWDILKDLSGKISHAFL